MTLEEVRDRWYAVTDVDPQPDGFLPWLRTNADALYLLGYLHVRNGTDPLDRGIDKESVDSAAYQMGRADALADSPWRPTSPIA